MGPNSMQEIIRSRVLHDTMETYEEGDSCTNSQPQQLIKQGGQLHALAHRWGPQVPIRWQEDGWATQLVGTLKKKKFSIWNTGLQLVAWQYT